MNTEQKARGWVEVFGNTRIHSKSAKIITALLAEREALLGALKDIISPFTVADEFATKDLRTARKAITLCEKEHE